MQICINYGVPQEMRHSSLLKMDFSIETKNFWSALFDARSHWNIANFNQTKLGKGGEHGSPIDVAPSKIVNGATVSTGHCSDLKFGFEYCRHVIVQVNANYMVKPIDNFLQHW